MSTARYTDSDGTEYVIAKTGQTGQQQYRLDVRIRNARAFTLRSGSDPAELRDAAQGYIEGVGLPRPAWGRAGAPRIFPRAWTRTMSQRRKELSDLVDGVHLPSVVYAAYEPFADLDGYTAFRAALADGRTIVIRRRVLYENSGRQPDIPGVDDNRILAVPRPENWVALLIDADEPERSMVIEHRTLAVAQAQIEAAAQVRPPMSELDTSISRILEGRRERTSPSEVTASTSLRQLPSLAPVQARAVPCPTCLALPTRDCITSGGIAMAGVHAARRRAAAMNMIDDAPEPPVTMPARTVSQSRNSYAALVLLAGKTAADLPANRPLADLPTSAQSLVDDYLDEMNRILREGGILNEAEQEMLTALLWEMRPIGRRDAAYLRMPASAWGGQLEMGDRVELDTLLPVSVSWRAAYGDEERPPPASVFIELRLGEQTYAIVSDDMADDVLLAHGQSWRVGAIHRDVNWGNGLLQAQRYIVLLPSSG